MCLQEFEFYRDSSTAHITELTEDLASLAEKVVGHAEQKPTSPLQFGNSGQFNLGGAGGGARSSSSSSTSDDEDEGKPSARGNWLTSLECRATEGQDSPSHRQAAPSEVPARSTSSLTRAGHTPTSQPHPHPTRKRAGSLGRRVEGAMRELLDAAGELTTRGQIELKQTFLEHGAGKPAGLAALTPADREELLLDAAVAVSLHSSGQLVLLEAVRDWRAWIERRAEARKRTCRA